MTKTPRAKRVQVLASLAEQSVQRSTDQMFAVLLLFQWLAGIGLALWLSPRTWVGPVSSPHIHLWAAVFLGGAIISLPLWLIAFKPPVTSTRRPGVAGRSRTCFDHIQLRAELVNRLVRNAVQNPCKDPEEMEMRKSGIQKVCGFASSSKHS